MSVHVDEVLSEVQVEPESPEPKGGGESVWQERERVRAMTARLRRDALRTHSRGYDD